MLIAALTCRTQHADLMGFPASVSHSMFDKELPVTNDVVPPRIQWVAAMHTPATALAELRATLYMQQFAFNDAPFQILPAAGDHLKPQHPLCVVRLLLRGNGLAASASGTTAVPHISESILAAWTAHGDAAAVLDAGGAAAWANVVVAADMSDNYFARSSNSAAAIVRAYLSNTLTAENDSPRRVPLPRVRSSRRAHLMSPGRGPRASMRRSLRGSASVTSAAVPTLPRTSCS
jgi:hypothetical protein